MKLKNINISDIKEAPYNIRFNTDEKAMESLINSIELNGLLLPLIAVPPKSPGGKYELISGHRRLNAVKKMGWEKVSIIEFIRFIIFD